MLGLYEMDFPGSLMVKRKTSGKCCRVGVRLEGIEIT